MTPTLIALAGLSRSGKGTCAAVFAEEAAKRGLTSRERQLSGPGKQYLASAFKPDITEDEAIAWFDDLKSGIPVQLEMTYVGKDGMRAYMAPDAIPLQQYLQRMLQGARDRWGTDFWTDKLLPPRGRHGLSLEPLWRHEFVVDDRLAQVCIISDLRQANEAERVRALGGVVVEVVRAEVEDGYVTGKDHITEQRGYAEYVTHTIYNDVPLDLFRDGARDLFNEIMGAR